MLPVLIIVLVNRHQTETLIHLSDIVTVQIHSVL